jgi:hypothetical protein
MCALLYRLNSLARPVFGLPTISNCVSKGNLPLIFCCYSTVQHPRADRSSCLTIAMESGNGHEPGSIPAESPAGEYDGPPPPPPRVDVSIAATALWAGLWVLIVIGFVSATVWAIKTIFGWFGVY